MASNSVDPSASILTASGPRWLWLQFPSWTNWLPTDELSTKSLTNQLTSLHRTSSTPLHTQSQESVSELLYDRQFTPISSSWRQTLCGSRPQIFFQLNPCIHSPYVPSSLTRGWVCLLWICLALSSVRIAHIACYWKFLLLHYIQVLCHAGFAKQIMILLLILCYNVSLVTRTVASLTTAKLKPHIFSMSYTANMFILMILYDFCFLPSQFCYIIVYIRKVESPVQIADRCAPCKISNGAQNHVLQALQF
jgi:hypothetical protein